MVSSHSWDFKGPLVWYSFLWLYWCIIEQQFVWIGFFVLCFFTDQSNGLVNILGALFVKHDHAAYLFFVTAWRKLAAALTQFCAAHDTRELKIFWDERADWWPQFHFRLSLVPNKDHVSELEWKLTRYKAEAARWLRGQGTCFVCTYKRFIVRFLITLV